MTLSLSTDAAIALVVTVGIVIAAPLLAVAATIASGRLSRVRFDQDQAGTDALASIGFAEHADTAIAVAEEPAPRLTFVDGTPVGEQRIAPVISLPYDPVLDANVIRIDRRGGGDAGRR